MADIPLDRMLQAAKVLDKNFLPITDESVRNKSMKVYEEIVSLLKYYCDIKDNEAMLFSIWTIGAINIEKFNTYPYLFVNAMKGSGKTRLIRLLAKLTGGDLVNSMTEAVLFRTKGTLAIDEFEGVNRKGNENLKELLNSAYKKGVKVKRMKKVKTLMGGEEMKVEEFEVFRPVIMANIWGMDEVLGDRCIKIVLNKSNNPIITKRIERYDTDQKIKDLVTLVYDTSLCFNVYPLVEEGWNTYLTYKYVAHDDIDITHTQDTQETHFIINKELDEEFLPFFNKIDEVNINGRSLELAFPLLFISYFLDKIDLFDKLLNFFKEIEQDKKDQNITESYDIAFIDFVSQEIPSNNFIPVREISQKFRDFLHEDKEWINPDWVGRALGRLSLFKMRKRQARGREVILDVEKAQEKIKMFK